MDIRRMAGIVYAVATAVVVAFQIALASILAFVGLWKLYHSTA